MKKRPDLSSLVLFPESNEDEPVLEATGRAAASPAAAAPRRKNPPRLGDYLYAYGVAGQKGGPSGYALVVRVEFPGESGRPLELAVHSCHLSPEECEVEVKLFMRTIMYRKGEYDADGRYFAVRRIELPRDDPTWDVARRLAERAAMFTDYDMRDAVRREIARSRAYERKEGEGGES